MVVFHGIKLFVIIFGISVLLPSITTCLRVKSGRARENRIAKGIRARQFRDQEVPNNIEFKFYDKHGEMYKGVETCNPKEKFAILVHGWRESCDVKWMEFLVSNLTEYRGGCIMCMDYSAYSRLEYGRLVRLFNPIVEVLRFKLLELEALGFNPDNGYMFGFSYGARLITEAALRFGEKRIKEIDCCDMAGPGFDARAQPDFRLAAKNVQCIQTSSDKGTRHNFCHQNWKLGNCGYSQPGARDPPLGSHGLCPYFYVSAFTNEFKAVEKPAPCRRFNTASFLEGFKMGYNETRKEQVQGELYAITGYNYPYNENEFNSFPRLEQLENFEDVDYSNDLSVFS